MNTYEQNRADIQEWIRKLTPKKDGVMPTISRRNKAHLLKLIRTQIEIDMKIMFSYHQLGKLIESLDEK